MRDGPETVAFDIDDVLADFTPFFINYVNNSLNRNVTIDDITSYDINKAFGVEKHVIDDLLSLFLRKGGYLYLPTTSEGYVEALRKMFAEGRFSPVYVTSRPEAAKAQTMLWLQKQELPNSDYIGFVNRGEKHSLLKAMDCMFLVDDNIEEHEKHRGVSYLVTRPWNVDAECPYRVRCGDDLLRRLGGWLY